MSRMVVAHCGGWGAGQAWGEPPLVAERSRQAGGGEEGGPGQTSFTDPENSYKRQYPPRGPCRMSARSRIRAERPQPKPKPEPRDSAQQPPRSVSTCPPSTRAVSWPTPECGPASPGFQLFFFVFLSYFLFSIFPHHPTFQERPETWIFIGTLLT